MILFGSRARGLHTEASDADVCIIAHDLPDDLLQRRYPAPSGYRFLSVFGFHPREFLDLISQGNPFALDIVRDGRVLYDDGYLAETRATYEAALTHYGLRRTAHGWEWNPALVAQIKGKVG
ncbi:MAG: nucleotidyltransferase domain-containing protein [Armatimonadetes bacterium]|nr:nucleotidyltransferase domain-containing protein [Armatimonadota bacterium]